MLDVGTGTGIWAIDFGDEHPSAEVLGTDLSPTQPTWVPPNVRFEIDDATKPWTWDAGAFDFVQGDNSSSPRYVSSQLSHPLTDDGRLGTRSGSS